MSYKILIYGIGEQYNKSFNIIKYFELTRQFEVVGVTARWTPNVSYLDGYRVIKTEELSSIIYDYILIMSDLYFDEIVENLIAKGIDRSRLLSYRIVQIPNLDFNKYIKLKNSRISIISNNCWGGNIYRTLGMECLSPFKNLSLEEEDYLKLLGNFREYMSYDLKFCKYAFNKNSQKNYPVMLLDDIKIHCNHDEDPQVSIYNWNKRREKINYNNLLFEMYTENEEIMERFLKIEGNKLCFVPFETAQENVYSLQLYPGHTYFWETVNSNAGNGSNSIEYNPLLLLWGDSASRQKE